MANRVAVNICGGNDYTFVAEESATYMQKVGAYVSDKMNEVLTSAKVGRTDAAVLAAVNIADELFKAQAASEQLRSRIEVSATRPARPRPRSGDCSAPAAG